MLYFNMLKNNKDDARCKHSTSVSLVMENHDTDSKGRRLIGSPLYSKEEVENRFDALFRELEETKKKAMKVFQDD